MEAGDVSSGMRQVGDKPASDRVGYPGKDDRDGTRCLQGRRDHRICGYENDIGREPHYFLDHATHPLLAVTGETVVEADVAPLGPAEVLQRLSEGLKVALPNFVIFGETHDHADTPRPVVLFRARFFLNDAAATE